MISLDDYYMGRDKTYADELTEKLRENAQETVRRVNLLLDRFGSERNVRSGWRPAEINANTPRAAKNSLHMTCEACDIDDSYGSLAKWCLNNLPVLEVIGLWMESPDATPTWVHVQTKPPKSGKRVFLP
jgi:hypothetical protein